jgi:hypothetical protein
VSQGESLTTLGENRRLNAAAFHGHWQLCQFLRFMRDCRTKAETPLHRAAAFGTAETIQRLLDAGAVVDAKDMNGESPLAWASWHLRPDSVLRKLCFGAHAMHSARRSTYDHGVGWEVMGVGTPRVPYREPR